ncbi:MAG: penicillin-binding protein activator [bacterium]
MKKTLRLFYGFCLLLSFAGCGVFETGGGQAVKVKYPNEVNAAWRTEFEQAETAFDAKNYSQAEKMYKDYVQKYPYNQLTDKSNFRLGQLAMLKQAYPQAIEIFNALIRKTPDPSMKSKAGEKVGLCYYRQKNYGEALSAFSAIDEKYLDEREKAKMASFAVHASTELKEDTNRRAYYYSVLYDLYEPLSDADINNRYGSETVPKAEVKGKFKEWIGLATPVETIDRRLLTYRGKYSGPYLDYKIGKSYYEAKNNGKAQEYLKRYVSKNGNHEYTDSAKKMLASMGASVPSSVGKKGPAVAVGVILPLSGKYEQYGNNTLKGMQCAASEKSECHGVSNIRLVVKDSGGDPQKGAALVDELVNQDKVVAILGPLASSEVEGIAKEAQAKGVPLLALAQKKGVPALGDNVFRFSLTPAAQVEALLRYMTHKKNAKTFGVLYPKNNYGEEFLAEFEKTAPEYGSKVTSKASFPPAKADLSDEVRQLKLSVSEMKAGGKGFDAVFIPDSYLAMSKVAPAMAKAEMNDVTAMGTNAWNDASLPSRIGSFVNSALFVDVYFRDSSLPTVQNFVRDFQAAYNYLPSTLEAMGYDSVRILGEAFSGKKISKKDDVKPLLLQVKGYQGVTGLKGFRGDREADVQPFILGVDGSGIKELQ